MRGKSTESDCDYFRRRAEEERKVADAATHELARDVHRELASRYEAMAEAVQQTVAPVMRIVR